MKLYCMLKVSNVHMFNLTISCPIRNNLGSTFISLKVTKECIESPISYFGCLIHYPNLIIIFSDNLLDKTS